MVTQPPTDPDMRPNPKTYPPAEPDPMDPNFPQFPDEPGLPEIGDPTDKDDTAAYPMAFPADGTNPNAG
jgi:hypothetical protein